MLPADPASLHPWLFALRRSGVRPSLAPLQAVLEALPPSRGPRPRPRPRPRTVQVLGTVGKGSVSATLAALFRAEGARVGLFTSPHLLRFNERVRVDGEDASDAELFAAFEAVLEAAPWAAREPREAGRAEAEARRGLTFFEWAVLLAAVHFKARGCDLLIFEAGLGGRWDGTTALPADLGVLTPIALDHQRILGDTLEAIASEKVSAFRLQAPVVSAAQAEGVTRVVEAAARATQAPLKIFGRDATFEGGVYRQAVRDGGRAAQAMGGLRTTLAGRHQEENAGLAILAANTLRALDGRGPLDAAVIRAGLEQVRWPGRLQWLHASLLCDGFHNRIGAEAAAAALPALLEGRALHLVFGCLRDRDPLALLDPFLKLAREITLVTPRSDRALEAGTYREAVAALHPRVSEADSLAAALRGLASSGDRPAVHLVGGSLYLVGEVLSPGQAAKIDPGDPAHLISDGPGPERQESSG